MLHSTPRHPSPTRRLARAPRAGRHLALHAAEHLRGRPLATVLLLLLAVMSACGGAQKASGPHATCAAAAANMRADAASGHRAGDADHARDAWFAQTIETVAAERCAADAWSPEAIDCLATRRGEAFEACLRELTPTQVGAIAEQVRAKFEADAGDPPETDELDPSATGGTVE